MDISLGWWDGGLIAVVSLQATALAYLHHPKWKALLLSLPFPFTLASLAVGRPIDTTNMIGMLFLLAYVHVVRALYARRVPILAAIGVAAGGYCVLGSLLARVLPQTETAFWVSTGAALAAAGLAHWRMPHRDEPGHRSPLPVYIKLPLIMGVIFLLVVVKQHLRGFVTMFPMVGLVASYEARSCLWTICRQIPVVIATMLPMMLVMRVTQAQWGWGIGSSLAAGWLVFLAVLVPVQRRLWSVYADEESP